LFGAEFALIALTTAGKAMDACKVARIGEFPCETNRGVEALFHLRDKAVRGHE
jgi:hypothetical protein